MTTVTISRAASAPAPSSSTTISVTRTTTAWLEIRATRNTLLTQCDWTQNADNKLTLTKRTAWAAYRQALRDVTKVARPQDVVWPKAPNA